MLGGVVVRGARGWGVLALVVLFLGGERAGEALVCRGGGLVALLGGLALFVGRLRCGFVGFGGVGRGRAGVVGGAGVPDDGGPRGSAGDEDGSHGGGGHDAAAFHAFPQ
ncbi:hypothetical protein EFW17_21325 [Halostreptopolyspora alba]|uniref:Uncharacterized protein n=1 Tax=Halostreptopolyspora alba TaxID=2487137 RepID=A0A3N0E216_9ACTN|nr:hypothetical protein EFW17_21325 [Nocardiopsaceae bacterium YIM 96095]